MFGGAGGLFGTLLQHELDSRLIVVPPFAGNFSAWGLLGQDVVRTASATRIRRLADDGLATADATLLELFAQLDARATVSSGAQREAHLDMRYTNQEHTLTVEVPVHEDGTLAGTAEELAGLFRSAHERTFGHSFDTAVEVVAMRATSRTLLPQRSTPRLQSGKTAPIQTQRRSLSAYSFTAGALTDFAMIDRDALHPGRDLPGPVIILEKTTTTYVDSGYIVRTDPTGSLLIGTQHESEHVTHKTKDGWQ